MESKAKGENVEEFRYWSCERKRPYESRATARAERKKMERRHGIKFQIYKCEFCRCFHLTKNRNGQ